MMKKFDPKKHQGKGRVYSPIPHAPRISKLWVWSSEDQRYEPPSLGKAYCARAYRHGLNTKPTRLTRFFDSIEEARAWQNAGEIAAIDSPAPAVIDQADELTLAKIVEEWKRRTFPSLKVSTRVAYEKLVRLYFGSLLPLRLSELTPQRVDFWLDELKDPVGLAMQSKRRRSFRHELEVLSAVFRYYEDYNDNDLSFRMPVKKRHWKAIELNRPYTPKSKDLTEQEFLLFRDHLAKRKHGEVMAPLASVQFFQALRISEAAGLFHEDVKLDRDYPHNSRMKIVRSICWPRQKGNESFVQGGFKNGKANGGIKEQPLFPQAYEALAPLLCEGKTGLIFLVSGKLIEYRSIQYAYDSAFRSAKLPYSATHVMRHGGCRDLLSETGDITIAQQHLGNSDLQSVQVYAKRYASALTDVAKKQWERKYQELGILTLGSQAS